jgi:hypothetical protein
MVTGTSRDVNSRAFFCWFLFQQGETLAPGHPKDLEFLVPACFFLDAVKPAVADPDEHPHEILKNPDRLAKQKNAFGVEDVENKLAGLWPVFISHDIKASLLVGGEPDEGGMPSGK